jgi:uncharacterized metal-binding protein
MPCQHNSHNTFLSATHLRRKLARKLLELFQLLSDVDFGLSIQQQGDNGLCAASVLDRLRRKEEVARRVMVVFAVLGCVAPCFTRRVLEEEDYAIDGA